MGWRMRPFVPAADPAFRNMERAKALLCMDCAFAFTRPPVSLGGHWSAEPVELPVAHAAEKCAPFVRRKPENRSFGSVPEMSW
jgi:hypothetical protein